LLRLARHQPGQGFLRRARAQRLLEEQDLALGEQGRKLSLIEKKRGIPGM
jgi:hypothetical protein